MCFSNQIPVSRPRPEPTLYRVTLRTGVSYTIRRHEDRIGLREFIRTNITADENYVLERYDEGVFVRVGLVLGG